MHRFRNRILASFRGLRWKLTLSYTLVTVAALLVVELAVLGIALFLLTRSDIIPRLSTETMYGAASELAFFLDDPTPDLNGINSWLQHAAVDGFSIRDSTGRATSFTPGPLAQDQGQLLVLDSRQNLLAILPANPSHPLGTPFDTSPYPLLGDLVASALAGEEDPVRLFDLTPERELYIAVPIQTQDRQVLGALVYTGINMLPQNPFDQLLPLFGASLVFFTVTAGAVGTVFGFFTARGFSRRLHTVAQVTSAWGQGDFSRVIHDRSGDEIGQLSRQLNRMAEQLENLLESRQELAALEERNRLARDLHDSVKQQAFAISMNLGAAQALWERDPAAARQRLDTASALARQTQGELTALIQTLRPAQLEGKGLAQALREHLSAWQSQTGIQTVCNIELLPGLPLEVEQPLFRVAQEALANVARHSGADQVKVDLSLKGRRVRLVIHDNGHGFDPQQSMKGMGLHSMQERIKDLDGDLKVDTGQQGTHVSAEVMLTKNS